MDDSAGGFAIDQDDPAKGWLSNFFEDDQLAMMEAAFECNTDCSSDTTDTFYEQREEWTDINGDYCNENIPIICAVEFGKKFDNSQERLEGIMQNVIDNKGTFVPPNN